MKNNAKTKNSTKTKMKLTKEIKLHDRTVHVRSIPVSLADSTMYTVLDYCLDPSEASGLTFFEAEYVYMRLRLDVLECILGTKFRTYIGERKKSPDDNLRINIPYRIEKPTDWFKECEYAFKDRVMKNTEFTLIHQKIIYNAIQKYMQPDVVLLTDTPVIGIKAINEFIENEYTKYQEHQEHQEQGI